MVRGNSNRLIRRLVVIPITVQRVYLAVHLVDLFTTLPAAGGPASGVMLNFGRDHGRDENTMTTGFADGCWPVWSGTPAGPSVTAPFVRRSAAHRSHHQSDCPTPPVAARLGARRQ